MKGLFTFSCYLNLLIIVMLFLWIGPTSNKSTMISVKATESLVEQSKTCTPEENLKQIQCLRELPAERYEVLQGEDVQMRCRVAHQRGKAQWRARNFLLGHVRAIPGWERYSLQGDPRLGIHDLVIQNVTNEDAGTFECQVSPADGHAPLRRQTILSILVKPSQPIIVAPSGEPQPLTNGQLIVPIPPTNSSINTSQEKLHLFCRSNGGIPPPTFEWFHNGRPVSNLVNTKRNFHPQRGDMSHFEGTEAQETEYYAKFVIGKHRLLTGDRLVCFVSNKATLRSKQLSNQKLRVEVLIIIHVAPGDPEIIDWNPRANRSHIFVFGASLGATCRSTPAGNPPGELIWRWERQKSIGIVPQDADSNPITQAFSQVAMQVPTEYVVQQYAEDKLLSKVVIPNLNASHHGLSLVCAVKHQIGPEKTAKVTVYVRYNPCDAYIDGPVETVMKLKENLQTYLGMFQRGELGLKVEGIVRYVYQDRPQYMQCLTSPYFDRAAIKWYGLLNITGQWEEVEPLETFSLPVESGVSNYVLTSIVQLVSTNAEHSPLRWSTLKCLSEPALDHLVNDVHHTIVRLVELRGYEPPGKPVILSYEHGNMFQEGTSVNVSCEAEAGNPVGHLIWLSSTGKSQTTEKMFPHFSTYRREPNRIWSSMQVLMTRDINGMLIKCAAINEGYNLSDRQVSTPFLLVVAFAATSINLTVSDETGRHLYPRNGANRAPKSPSDLPIQSNMLHQLPMITTDAGVTISVTCQVDLSNPPPRIQWRLHQCRPLGRNKTTHESLFYAKRIPQDNCHTSALEGAENAILNTSVIQSNIQMQLNWSHHESVLECFARPISSYDVATRDLPVELLNFARTSQSESSEKTLRKRLFLNVRFRPTFDHLAERLKWSSEEVVAQNTPTRLLQYVTSEGGKVNIDLDPLANPPAHKYVWLKNHETLVTYADANEAPFDTMKHVVIQSSNLRIQPVRIDDMANYTLLATNTRGTGGFRFFLNVTYSPKLVGESSVNVTVSGLKAVLQCEVEANPLPNENAVRWRRLSRSPNELDTFNIFHQRSSTVTDPKIVKKHSYEESIAGIRCNKGKWHSGFKYFAKCWSPAVRVLTSSLTIYDLGPSDVGRYQCYMDNAVGSPAVKNVDLIYPFAPKMMLIPRWAKAAPNMQHYQSVDVTASEPGLNRTNPQSPRYQARLTCVIAAEPIPTVKWTREPANLTLVEGGQFYSKVKPVQPGLYHAILYLNKPEESDSGIYYCTASNFVGSDTGRVELVQATKPDPLSTPRLINATSVSLAIAWTQGFNGGPSQKFLLRWALNDKPDENKQVNVVENLDSETIVYDIKGLRKATTYRISVSSGNEPFGMTAFSPYLLASTKAHDPILDDEAMRDEARAKSSLGVNGGHWNVEAMTDRDRDHENNHASWAGLNDDPKEDKVVSIIVAASVFGSVVLMANMLVIFLLAQRKRRKANNRKTSVISGTEVMKLRSTGPSITEMSVFHPQVYTAYGDGTSLPEEVLLQSRSHEKFSPFRPDLSPVAMNMGITDDHNPFSMNQPFAGSPHPSLQTIGPIGIHASHQFDLNLATIQPPVNDLTESDVTTRCYMSTDANPPSAVCTTQPYLAAPLHNCDFLRGTHSTNNAERYTSVGGGINAHFNVYPPIHRMDSPHSGTNSFISATRSVGYPNTHSLERKAFHPTHNPPHHHMPSLVRQTSFGHYTPNGTYIRNLGDHGTSHITRSNVTTFTPNHTLAKYRVKAYPMASSVYTERGFGQLGGYDQISDQDEAALAVSNCQLVRRGSHYTYKSPDLYNSKNNSQLLNVYLKRYNDQLQSVRAMGQCVESPKANLTESSAPCQTITLINTESSHSNDGLIIPPPNAFAPVAKRHISPQRITNLPTNTEIESTVRHHFQDTNRHITVKEYDPIIKPSVVRETSFVPMAQIKRPTPDQTLIYTNNDQNKFSGLDSVV